MNDRRPSLEGVRVLAQGLAWAGPTTTVILSDLGAEVIEIPFIEIRPPRSFKQLDAALKNISKYDWLILTSVNGVEAVAARLKRLKIKPRSLSSLQVAAIGPSTRDAAEKLGLAVAIVPRQYVAESVVESLRGKVEGKRVLLARARVARDVIPRELRKRGAKVDVVEAYETVAPAASRKKLLALMSDPKRRPHVVTFTSSSTARNFVTLLGGRSHLGRKRHEEIQFASIGPITSATLRELGLPVHIKALKYTIPGLVEAIVSRNT